jgi:hypothetical protein
MGSGAMEAFLKDADVLAWANKDYYNLLKVSPENPVPAELQKFVTSGWIPRGVLYTPKGYRVWLFNYNKTYQNLSGTITPYMPTDSVLICDTMARCDRLFGPPERLPIDPESQQLYMFYFGVDMSAPMMPPNIVNPGLVNPMMFHCDCYKSKDEKRLTIRTQSAPVFVTTQTDAFAHLYSVLT